MLRVVLATAVLSLLVLSASALYGPKSDVILLNKNNFQHQLASSRLPWFIEIFAPWCGHCKNLAPTYDKLATKLKGVINVAAIDGDSERELAGMFGVRGFPTLKFWNGVDFDSKKAPKWEDYNGARELGAMESFAASRLSSFLEVLNSEQTLDDWLAARPELPHVLLLSDKDKVTPLYKAMSMQYRERAVFAQVNAKTHSAIATRFKATTFPTLLVLKKGADEPIVMQDKLSASTVNKFIGQHALLAQTAGSQQQSQEKPKSAPPKEEPAHAVLVEARNQEQFDEACGKKAMGVCFIAVMNPEEPEEHARALAALQAAADKHKTRFHYVWINGLEQEPFVKQFALFSGFPAAVAYSPSRLAYAPFVGAWDTDSLHSFLSSVLSSGTRLAQTKAPPVIVSRPATSSSSASDSAAADESAAGTGAATEKKTEL